MPAEELDNAAASGAAFADLVRIMARLLAPDGCPWDREQTLATLRPYLLEETYEVLEAMDGGTTAEHCDELGDLLMQIVFQAALCAREGAFAMPDVIRSIADKLVRRHPHVFADAIVHDAAGVVAQWDEIKARERAGGAASRHAPARVLTGVPRALPALARAQRLSERAAGVGFDWPDVAGCRAKVQEEIAEIDRAIVEGDRERIEAELGDLLFAVVSLTRKLGLDAESALRNTADRFVARFEHIEDALFAQGRAPRESTLVEMDALWERAKRAVR
jgi:MazG family protein